MADFFNLQGAGMQSSIKKPSNVNNKSKERAVYSPERTYTGSKPRKTSGSGYEMELSDFFKVMAAQLKFQDPGNPMDTEKMVASLLQTQVVQAVSRVTDAMTQMQHSSAIQYATSLFGKEVTVAEIDPKTGKLTGKDTKGKVEGVVLGAEPLLVIDGEKYHLMQVMSVGNAGETESSDQGNQGN